MGNVYLILGASSDLGIEFLQTHSWLKDDVIIAQYCYSVTRLQQLSKALTCTMKIVKADFLSENSTKRFVQELKNMQIVPTHILHIPAIPVENKRFTEYTWQEAEQQLNVQVRSIFFVLHEVLPKMAKNKKGKIVIVLSSSTIDVPPKFLATYIMMKYALMGLGKALAIEYAQKNILVNMVSPSMMETAFLHNIYRQVIEQSAINNPMKRNATVKDVVPLLQYLFSEQNTFITGTNIPITGGENF